MERRTAKRRPILEGFSFFVCVPRLGFARHSVLNLSDSGIGFQVETLGAFTLDAGQIVEVQLYLNPKLYLSLSCEVIRYEIEGTEQYIGAKFLDTDAPSFKTYQSLLKFIDQLEISGLPSSL